MASSQVAQISVSMKEFLRMPKIEETATPKHKMISLGFYKRLNPFVEPEGLGLAMVKQKTIDVSRGLTPERLANPE